MLLQQTALALQVLAAQQYDLSIFSSFPIHVVMQVLTTQLAAKQNGYADVVYLDAKTDTYLEEVSSCNIFIVKDRNIKTPELLVRSCCSA